MHAVQNQLVSGGHDGKVNLYQVSGSALQKMHTIDLKDAALGSMDPKATALCLGPQNAILIGTRGGEIMEAKGSNQPVVRMRAHWDQELWGLAMHPTNAEMITVGRDAMLAFWDMPTRKQKVNYKLDGPADAVAISNNG